MAGLGNSWIGQGCWWSLGAWHNHLSSSVLRYGLVKAPLVLITSSSERNIILSTCYYEWGLQFLIWKMLATFNPKCHHSNDVILIHVIWSVTSTKTGISLGKLSVYTAGMVFWCLEKSVLLFKRLLGRLAHRVRYMKLI